MIPIEIYPYIQMKLESIMASLDVLASPDANLSTKKYVKDIEKEISELKEYLAELLMN